MGLSLDAKSEKVVWESVWLALAFQALKRGQIMKRLTLVAVLLAATACVPVVGDNGYAPFEPRDNGLPVHPDPYCTYTEPFEPGGPLGEVCS